MPAQLTMSAAEFRSAYPGEGQYVEFKTGASGAQLQNTAVAFSNADGGVILIGVTDDGEIHGRALDAGTADDIHRALQDARDVGRYSLHQMEVEGRPVTAVSVARRREGFAQTSSGVPRVRRGTRDDALFGAELVRFVNERTASRFETTAVNATREAIDPRLRGELAKALGWDRATPSRLRDAGLLCDERLTVTGALYLVREPDQELGKAYVEILRYPDDTTIDYDRREEIHGPIHHVLRDTVARLTDELGSELVVLGVRRYELPRLPEIVLREAVANALAHRSYEATGAAVRIELRPSLLTVRSPGGLPEPVTVENIREANAARNLTTIRILRQLGLAEDAGRGVDLMQDAMAEEMLDPPRFHDNGHEVLVELPIRSVVSPAERAWLRELEQRGTLTGPDRLVLVHAARGEVLTNARVREILGPGVDSAGARETLKRLRDEHLLEQRGQRGGASYRLAGTLKAPAGLRLSAEELDDVVARLAAEQPISNRDVRAATGLERAEALSILDRLVTAGRLRRTGERRGTKYHAP
jgi:ATP-dependent DNA helicase RecG